VLAAIVTFVHRPGRLITDTKLDLPIDPGRFLARTLNLWDQSAFFGQIQNQAVGYLFPMGPWFAFGHRAGIAGWILQRGFEVLLVMIGSTGVMKLARAFRIGTPGSRALAGLLYAWSPTVMIMWGATSAAVVGIMLTPWILLPLVTAKPERHPASAALKSAFAVCLTGGINATCTFGACGLAVVFILVGRRGKGRIRLGFWWGVGLGLSWLWWILPLLFQGKFGFNFLVYTERARLTANAMSATDLLRGSTNWLSYLGLGRPWSKSGWMIGHTPAVVAATSMIGITGLIGLSRPNMPHRNWLGLSAVGTAAFMGMGYGGPTAGAIGPFFQTLLDGPISLARNLYKFDPAFRLPLALGFAHITSEWFAWSKKRAARTMRRRRITPYGHRVRLGAVVFIVIAQLSPVWTGRFMPDGTYVGLPLHWRQAAKWVTDHEGDGITQLAPTSAFADYLWGRTMDEPFQTLIDAPWSVRSLVPLGGDGSIRFLDSVEDVIATGHGSPGLPDAMAAVGVKYLLVRNDLDWQRARTARPSIVKRAMQLSGLEPVIGFGKVADIHGYPEPDAEFGIAAQEARYPAIEIWQTPRAVGRVSTLDVSTAVEVAGGPESLVPASAAGLTANRALLLRQHGDALAEAGEQAERPIIVSDAQRRVNNQFGLTRDHRSYTLGPDELKAGEKRNQQYDFPGPNPLDQATAEMIGVKAIHASTYGSVLLELPELQPAAAMDGDSQTAWVADTWVDKKPWWEVTFNEARELPSIKVSVLDDGYWRADVTAITAVTDAGSATTTFDGGEQLRDIAVPPGPTTTLRLEMTYKAPFVGAAGAGFREVQIQGVTALRSIRVPQRTTSADDGGPAPTFAFDRQIANPYDILRRDTEPTMTRSFFTRNAQNVDITATVVATPGQQLQAMVEKPGQIVATATSRWGDLPDANIVAAFDRNPDTAWVARPAEPPKLPAVQPADRATPSLLTTPRAPVPVGFDPTPTVTMSWPEKRTLSSMELQTAAVFGAAPLVMRLESPDGVREFSIENGWAEFEPLTTDRMTITFPKITERITIDVANGAKFTLPIGLAEMRFPALDDLEPPTIDDARQITLTCDEGPKITIDGVTYGTSATVDNDYLIHLKPFKVKVCNGEQVRLAQGEHLLTTQKVPAFNVMSVVLNSGTIAPATPTRTATVTKWSPSVRAVDVGPGPATILHVHEALNIGFVATLNGKTLTPVMVQGWQQGFIVPAGEGGTVDIVFAANPAFRIALAVGMSAMAGLVGILIFAWRRNGKRPVPWTPWGGMAWPLAGLCAVVMAGLLSVVSIPLLIGGLVLQRARPQWRHWMVALPALTAGAIAAIAAPVAQPGVTVGTYSAPAQILTVLSLTLFASQVLERSPHRDEPDADRIA
jgi:arabinofuranan 3-O-arabinosyltransferase